ncbi:MAG: LolA family protein, partial [Syntrophothermus sp.]
NIKDLSAGFTQTSGMNQQGRSISTKGQIFFQKENKYRIEFKNQQIITDGSTIWNYNKKSNKVVVNELKNEKSVFSFKYLIEEIPSGSKVEAAGQETISGVRCSVIKIIPGQDSQSIKYIKVWADGSSLIRKIELTDESGLINIFEFFDIKVNSDLPSQKFTFEPPKGSDIVDLR